MNRMEFILRNVLVLCFLLGMQVGRGQVRVAGVDAADDVDTYFAHIEGTHPNPYWHTPRAEVEHFRDSVKALCLGQDSVDVGELSYWLAQGNHFFDYHTACDIEVKGVKEAVFFSRLAFEGERILWEGKEVKSIGGYESGDILQAIKRCMGADVPWGTCCYELNHWTLGQKVMLYMGLRPPFAVQFADGTETTVAGYTYADLQQMYNEETREDYSFEMYELDSIAIIRFNRYIMGGFQDFRMFLQRSFDLIQKRGVRYLFIDVWATWCGGCVMEIPYMEKLQEHFANDKRIKLISISWDYTQEVWLDYLKKRPATWAQYIVDKKNMDFMKKEYRMTFIPRFLLLDPEGRIISIEFARPSDPECVQILEEIIK